MLNKLYYFRFIDGFNGTIFTYGQVSIIEISIFDNLLIV